MGSSKVALVTGGSRGIGLAIARALGSSGFRLALCGRRSEQEVAPQLDALRQEGMTVLYVRSDVGQSQARRDLVRTVRDELGALHVLVNNAGMAPRVRADLLEATEESFWEVLRTNLAGPYFLTQQCAIWMLEQQQVDSAWSGCIVNISSMSAVVASVNRGEYCLSKAALSMATKLWATRLGEFGIPVYEVRPGVVRTDMTAAVEDAYSALLQSGLTIERRWGVPEDVATAVAALVGGQIPYSTGHVVWIDGGLTVQRL